MSLQILLIDDEQDVRLSLSKFLGRLGHSITCAPNAAEGLISFNTIDFDVVISDIRMPGMDGLELLQQIKSVQNSPVSVIIITGHGDMEKAITALKYGAYDYLQKPIDVRELALTLERIEEFKILQSNYRQLKKDLNTKVAEKTRALRGEAERIRHAYLQEVGLGHFKTYSPVMQEVLDLARRYSTDRSIPVLIQGESGTGKELIARFVHYYQANDPLNPFVAVNCGAISSQLFESEFFGYSGGAFTGAAPEGRKGKLEMAHRGTLFLDEVGELPLDLQVKLLRALEEKKFYRVGGSRELPVDVRIISATSKDLAREVREGRFRTDLYYRINTGKIVVPPLRQRQEGILPLALYYAGRAAARQGKDFGSLRPEAKTFLRQHPWPGNVRQLKNMMERLALLKPLNAVGVQDLVSLDEEDPTPSAHSGPSGLGQAPYDLPESGLDLEGHIQAIIRQALEKHQGNQTKTAQYLGISRRVLQGRLKKGTT